MMEDEKLPNDRTDVAEEILEDVLVVPKKLTKRAYDILVRCNANPRPYHLEGRFGSRTHRIDETSMGLPIISKARVESQAKLFPELQELVDASGVSLLRKSFLPALRAVDLPEVDARMHPERERKKAPSSTKSNNSCENTPKALFTYAELFAGIGGFGVALEALGGQCVFVSELEESCRKLYQHNFPKTKPENMHGDIYQCETFPSSCDLLVGGFPCQPFSALGDQPGLECAKGHLFLEIVRFLQQAKPKAFLLENVPGLKAMKEFDIIVKSLEECGYAIETQVCTSRGLTATNRKRLFFVGLQKNTSTANQFEFPFLPDLKLRAHHVLDYDYLSAEELDLLRLAETTMNQLLSNGRTWRPKSLAWPNCVLDTMTSHYGNAVGRGETQLVPCQAPHNPRRFSIRECARIMGFPNTYQFLPPSLIQGDMAYRKQHYRMFGNAVCPPLIAALAGAVLDSCILDKNNHDWVAKGYDTAIQLAIAATRPPVELPPHCLIPPKNIERAVGGGEAHAGKRQKTE